MILYVLIGHSLFHSLIYLGAVKKCLADPDWSRIPGICLMAFTGMTVVFCFLALLPWVLYVRIPS